MPAGSVAVSTVDPVLAGRHVVDLVEPGRIDRAVTVHVDGAVTGCHGDHEVVGGSEQPVVAGPRHVDVDAAERDVATVDHAGAVGIDVVEHQVADREIALIAEVLIEVLEQADRRVERCSRDVVEGGVGVPGLGHVGGQGRAGRIDLDLELAVGQVREAVRTGGIDAAVAVDIVRAVARGGGEHGVVGGTERAVGSGPRELHVDTRDAGLVRAL